MINQIEIAKNLKDAAKYVKKGYLPFAGGTEITRLNSYVVATKFVSLKNCGLNTIENEGEYIKIGAMCTFTDLVHSELIPEDLKKALYFNSSLQKRNMATIGGNIAMNRDDSYLMPALIAYGAEVELEGSKERYPLYLLEDIVTNGKILTYIYIDKCHSVVSERVANTKASHALLTASIGGHLPDEYTISIAIKGIGIISMFADDESYKHIFDDIKFKTDIIYGSKEYKKYISETIVNELVKEYKERTRG